MKTARPGGLLAMLGVLSLGGCYAYGPAAPGAVEPGQEVRVRLNAGEARNVGGFLEGGDGPDLLWGTVEPGSDRDTLLLGVGAASGAPAGPRRVRRVVPVATAGVVELEVSSLDRRRTFTLAGLAALVAAAVVVSQLDDGEGPDTGEGPGGIDEVLIPIFSIGW